MFKYYLKSARRNLLKKKGFSLINITGLTIGLTCCLLIALYIKDELCYDDFEQKVDRIARKTFFCQRLPAVSIQVAWRQIHSK